MALKPHVCSHVFYPSVRAFVVEHYLLSQSYLKCQDDFRSGFPKCQVSDESTVFRLVSHFSEAVHKAVVTLGRKCVELVRNLVAHGDALEGK